MTEKNAEWRVTAKLLLEVANHYKNSCSLGGSVSVGMTVEELCSIDNDWYLIFDTNFGIGGLVCTNQGLWIKLEGDAQPDIGLEWKYQEKDNGWGENYTWAYVYPGDPIPSEKNYDIYETKLIGSDSILAKLF